MAKEKYTIDGQTYEVETGPVSKDKNGGTVQALTINGQKMTLTVQDTLDNSKKYGKNVVLRINFDKKYIEGDGYTGISKSEIYKVLEAREKAGKATQLEKVAVYQQQYNNLAKAEALAKGNAEFEADLMKLTDRQISGSEAFPPLKEKFPWAFASRADSLTDKVSRLWSDDAKFRIICREKLEEVKQTAQKYDMFDEMHINAEKGKGTIKDQFAMQEKASKAKSAMDIEKVDEGTERLVAAAEKKKTEKENAAKEKTAAKEMPFQPANDGHDMA